MSADWVKSGDWQRVDDLLAEIEAGQLIAETEAIITRFRAGNATFGEVLEV